MRKLLNFILVVVDKLRGLFLRWWLSHQKGIELGRNLFFVGAPRIEIRNAGRIVDDLLNELQGPNKHEH